MAGESIGSITPDYRNSRRFADYKTSAENNPPYSTIKTDTLAVSSR
jgi:hypothetical protein